MYRRSLQERCAQRDPALCEKMRMNKSAVLACAGGLPRALGTLVEQRKSLLHYSLALLVDDSGMEPWPNGFKPTSLAETPIDYAQHLASPVFTATGRLRP